MGHQSVSQKGQSSFAAHTHPAPRFPHCSGGAWAKEIGHLGPGACGDVTLLTVEPVDVQLEDCHKQVRRVRKRIRAKAVLRAGKLAYMTEPEAWPNPNSGRPSDLAGLVVRDEDWEDVMKQYNCC